MNVFDLFAKLSIDTSGYENGLSKAKSLAGTFGSGISSAAKLGVAAVSSAANAITNFSRGAVNAGMQFDSAMAGVAATLGKSVDEMNSEIGTADTAYGDFTGTLEEFAQFLGSNTAFSATQAAEALNYMALAGYNTQQSMDMLPSVLDMAAAGGMDLARASDMITDTQSALGLSAERTTQMVNEFAKAASTGNTSVEQLGDALLTVGGLASELNGGMVKLADGTTSSVDGVQELEIAFTAMANAGIKGSEAGTHMRNMIMKLSSPTSEGTELLKKMGITVFDSEGKMRSLADIMGDLNTALGQVSQEEKIQAISTLFNARDLSSAEALLSAVNQDWDKIGESILDAESAASGMAKTKLDTLSGSITYFNSALEGAQIAISDVLSPALRDIVDFGATGLSELTTAFKNGGLTEAVTTFGEIIADGLNQITENLPTMINVGINFLKALGKGLIDNFPVLVASLVDVGKMLSEEFLSILSKAADGLKAFDFGVLTKKLVTFLVDAITNEGAEFLSIGFTILTTIINGAFEAFPELVNGAIQIIEKLTEGINENLPMLISTGLNALMQFSYSLRVNAGELINAGLELIVQLAEGIIQALPVMVQTLPTIITNIANIINDNAPKLLFAGVTILLTLITGIVETIPTLIQEFPKVIQAIFSVITAVNWVNLGGTIITGITNGVKALSANLPTALKSIGTKAKNVLQLINWRTLGQDIIDLIVIGVKALAQALPTALNTIGSSAASIFKSIDWVSLGTAIVNGLWSGLSNTTQWLKDKITDWCGGIWENITSFFGIHSPSKLFAWAGENMALGLGAGFGEEMDSVSKAMTESVPTNFNITPVENAKNQIPAQIVINIQNVNGLSKDTAERFSHDLSKQLFDMIYRDKAAII